MTPLNSAQRNAISIPPLNTATNSSNNVPGYSYLVHQLVQQGSQDALATQNLTSEPSASFNSRSVESARLAGTSALRDSLNNPNVASHFETAVSLAVLESRGPGAQEVDRIAKQLATALENLESNQDQRIFNKEGEETTLRQVFEKGILKTTAPAAPGTENSAFLGRCIDSEKEPENSSEWDRLGGLRWLINQLKMDCTSETYNHNNFLVKIKALADFGELLTDLIATEKAPKAKEDSSQAVDLSSKERLLLLGHELPTQTKQNIHTMRFFSSALGYKDLDSFINAFSIIKGLTRNAAFNTLREREERLPSLPDGSSLTYREHFDPDTKASLGFGLVIKGQFLELKKPLTATPKKGGGCGNEYTEESVHPEDLHTNQTAAQLVVAALKEGKQTKMYEGAPVTNTARPGFCTDAGAKSPPPGFEFLSAELEAKPYPRAIGVNRWNVVAEFSEMCHNRGLPVVGAHSGTTADIMIACEILGHEPLNETQTNLLSVMIHSYMAYGACHSMAEVFSVVDAVRDGTQFTPHKELPHFLTFYADYMERAKIAVGEEESVRAAAGGRTESSFSFSTSTSSDGPSRNGSNDNLSRATSPLSTELLIARTESSPRLGEMLHPRKKLERADSSFRQYCTAPVVAEILESGRVTSRETRLYKETAAERLASGIAFNQRIQDADIAWTCAQRLFQERIAQQERHSKRCDG